MTTPDAEAPGDAKVGDGPALDAPDAPVTQPDAPLTPDVSDDNPAPMCGEHMRPCTGSGDCCGALRCDMGVCICRAPGNSCERDADCCSAPDFACRGGMCASTAMCTIAEGGACAPGAEAPNCCTGGRRCVELRCCQAVGATCATDASCCGTGRCQTGRCCAPTGATCTSASECCGGGSCTGGRCAPACSVTLGAMCVRDSRMDDECCARGECGLAATGAGRVCCLAAGTTCSGSDTCCGGSCRGGRCCGDGSGRASCADNSQCCSDALCVMGVGGTETTCKRGPGQACDSRFDCASDACTGGMCARMPAGEACRTNADCASGRCSDGTCG